LNPASAISFKLDRPPKGESDVDIRKARSELENLKRKFGTLR